MTDCLPSNTPLEAKEYRQTLQLIESANKNTIEGSLTLKVDQLPNTI